MAFWMLIQQFIENFLNCAAITSTLLLKSWLTYYCPFVSENHGSPVDSQHTGPVIVDLWCYLCCRPAQIVEQTPALPLSLAVITLPYDVVWWPTCHTLEVGLQIWHHIRRTRWHQMHSLVWNVQLTWRPTRTMTVHLQKAKWNSWEILSHHDKKFPGSIGSGLTNAWPGY